MSQSVSAGPLGGIGSQQQQSLLQREQMVMLRDRSGSASSEPPSTSTRHPQYQDYSMSQPSLHHNHRPHQQPNVHVPVSLLPGAQARQPQSSSQTHEHASDGQQHHTSYSNSTSLSSLDSQANSQTSAHAHFNPVTVDDLLAAHSHLPSKALAALVTAHNSLASAYANERVERQRLRSENGKVWSMCTNLQRERDALQRDVASSSSVNREIRFLSGRVMDLEAALRLNGLSVPPSNASRLSPIGSDVGDAELPFRRPSPGPRSTSDVGPRSANDGHSLHANMPVSRDKTRTAQYSVGGMSSSASTNSFTTATSDPALSASSSSSSRLDLGVSKDGRRDRRERDITPTAATLGVNGTNGRGTPTIQSQNVFIASPALSQGAFSSQSRSLPPISSSASYNSHLNSASHSEGLGTIPATPQVQADDDFADYTASPTVGSFAGVEHLRVARNSPLPISPALSSHSRISSSQHSAATSPRSPHWTAPPSPSIGSSRAPDSPRHHLRHTPQLASSQATYRPSSETSSAVLPGAIQQQRRLTRKASSLDLTAGKAKSPALPLPGRSVVTPPPDLGASPPMLDEPASPFTAETRLPRTPSPPPVPARDDAQYAELRLSNSARSDSNSLFSTPLVELPDEARRYIMVQNGGGSLPSPTTPLRNREDSEDSRITPNPTQRPGGLGITHIEHTNDSNRNLQVQEQARRASSALQATMATETHLMPQSQYVSGRTSPSRQPANGHQHDHSGYASSSGSGHRQPQAHNLDEGSGTKQPESPSRLARPALQPRRSSDRSSDREHNAHHANGISQAGQSYPPSGSQLPSSFGQYNNPASGGYIQYSDTTQPAPSQKHSLQQPPPPRTASGRHSESNDRSAAYDTNNGEVRRRPLQLIASLLNLLQADIVTSTFRTGDKGKEVVSFLIRVNVRKPPKDDARMSHFGPGTLISWLIEKTWADFQTLDHAIKNKNAKGNVKKLPSLPERNLFKDNAPSRVDQRKVELQRYLHGLYTSKLQELGDLCHFLTSNVVLDRFAPVSNPGHKAGYLSKKGRNLGGWATRYYVLRGRMLEYYESAGGSVSGTIDLKGASIGRQNHKMADSDEIRHAFLIRAKDKHNEDQDHILCAESDEERDHWVSMLICCTTGEYVPETIAVTAPTPTTASSAATSTLSTARPTGQSLPPSDLRKVSQPQKKASKEVETLRGAQPPSQSQDGKFFGGPTHAEPGRANASSAQHPQLQQHKRDDSAGHSSIASGADVPTSRNERSGQHSNDVPASSSITSGLAHLSASEGPHHPSQNHHQQRLGTAQSDKGPSRDANRPMSPEKRMKISGPVNGAPIGPDFKKTLVPNERRAKVKSSFWDFASRRGNERKDAGVQAARPVFGVPIQEAVEIARVREDSDLPAVVFRCVQYLSSVKAEEEEGIYRLSGSSAVIKALKDRFNAEGDVDLTSEYFDPHAVAGLLKQFFRELPVHIFTAELNPEFVKANDIEDHKHRVRQICRLVQMLPVANYSALRFLSAHLVNLVKHESQNKMSVRNMGIVFSPTLAIPSTLFSLFINEFDRIFREIDAEDEPVERPGHLGDSHAASGQLLRERPSRAGQDNVRRRSRNSKLFTQSGADRLLEVVSDFDSPAEDDPASGKYSSTSHDPDTLRSVSPAYNEETVRAGAGSRQHMLKIDTATDRAHAGSAGSSGGPRSPALSTASSPRNLFTPMRSPGLPASPRHVEGYIRQ